MAIGVKYPSRSVSKKSTAKTLLSIPISVCNVTFPKVFPEVPPKVEYSLTQKGQEVQPILAALHHVGQQRLREDGEAQQT